MLARPVLCAYERAAVFRRKRLYCPLNIAPGRCCVRVWVRVLVSVAATSASSARSIRAGPLMGCHDMDLA